MEKKNIQLAAKIQKETLEAEKRIRPHIRETPLEYSPYLSKKGSCEAYLKLENVQLSGSFKLRGAMNKLLSLSEAEKKKGIVTASSGNHAAATAYALKKLALKGTVYLPENTAPIKIDSLRLNGANIKVFGEECVTTELHARKIAKKHGLYYISPYNDMKIIGGQGTIGLEMENQLDGPDAVFVPVGGGGLISGIAGYLKAQVLPVQVIGCLPSNSPVMYESVKAGRIIPMDSLPTLSDGSAGNIEPGTITLDFCKALVDEFVLVSEEEIKEAIKLVISWHHMLVEGAAALSVAAFIKTKKRFQGKKVALIISGAKISLDTLKKILE